jgi:metal-sulfur cluster biosynthetic enzyme
MNEVQALRTGGQQNAIAQIRAKLNTIGDPCSVAQGVPMGIDDMGLVRDVQMDEVGNVAIELRLTSPSCHIVGYFDVEAKRRVLGLPGVRSVTVEVDLGLDWRPEMMSEDAKARRRRALEARGAPNSSARLRSSAELVHRVSANAGNGPA